MNASPLLSVVVPTRNRYPYLAALLSALTKFKSMNFEVLVHDNSDGTGRFNEFCGSIQDRRIRYEFSPDRLSITENFERGIEHSHGRYVCMIGDDDGVTEGIVALADMLERASIDAAVFPVPTYLWPGVGSALDGRQMTGILRVPRYTGRVSVLSVGEALEATIRAGGTRIVNLPGIYQGVVSREALRRLKALAGTYFPGASPDMASAVGLSAVIDQVAKVDWPFVISGSSPGSGAAQGSERAHEGELADKSFLPPGTADRWPAEVPFYFSGPTLWAATLVEALRVTRRADRVADIRWDRLYAACRVFNPRFSKRVSDARARNPGLVTRRAYVGALVWVWSERARALAKNLATKGISMLGRQVRSSGLCDIDAVVTYLGARFDALPEQDRLETYSRDPGSA